MTGEEEAAPEPALVRERRTGLACMWCGRTGQEFRLCCDDHPDSVVCRDHVGCAEYSLFQSREIERRHGLS